MRKFILLFVVMMFCLNVFAGKALPLKYKNIKPKQKIYYNQALDLWQTSSNKTDKYFEKTVNDAGNNIYVNADKSPAFITDCDYEFINNGKFFCFSNKDLNFYNLSLDEYSKAVKTSLTEEEMTSLLPDYKIIKLSEFSSGTHTYKFKKHFGAVKIFLLNDTKEDFSNYSFTSGNAKFEQYSLAGFIKILSPGMIQFSSKETYSQNLPWYFLLVR